MTIQTVTLHCFVFNGANIVKKLHKNYFKFIFFSILLFFHFKKWVLGEGLGGKGCLFNTKNDGNTP